MDNAQAAAVLRAMPGKELFVYEEYEEAVERGAEALEMLGWLLTGEAADDIRPRVYGLYEEWLGNCQHSFRAYCEERFEESKNA